MGVEKEVLWSFKDSVDITGSANKRKMGKGKRIDSGHSKVKRK